MQPIMKQLRVRKNLSGLGQEPLQQNDEAKEMIAGLNKTVMAALAVGGFIWYFWLRK